MKTRIFLLLAIASAVFIGFTSQSIAISIPRLKGKVASVSPHERLSSIDDKEPIVLERIEALGHLADEILGNNPGSQQKSFTLDYDDGGKNSQLLIILSKAVDTTNNKGRLQISIASLHPFDKTSAHSVPLFQMDIFTSEEAMDIAFEIETGDPFSVSEKNIPKRISPKGGIISIKDGEEITIHQIKIPGFTLPPCPEFGEAELWNLFGRTDLNITEILHALMFAREEAEQRERINKAHQSALYVVFTDDPGFRLATQHALMQEHILIARQNGGKALLNGLTTFAVFLLFGGIGFWLFRTKSES